MIDIKDFLGFKEKLGIDQESLPKHIGLTINGSFAYAKQHKIPLDKVYLEDYESIKAMMQLCIKLKIPILTFYIPLGAETSSQKAQIRLDSLERFFTDLSGWDVLTQDQVKVSVFGKWYDLSSRIIEPIKSIISATAGYDSFFLNLCINYDGKEEIVDACKLLARRVKAGKIDPDSITADVIKENIYTSYFVPPDLIIKTGKLNKLYGFMLWDSTHAKIFFSKKSWPTFDKVDFLRAIKFYQDRG